MEKTIKEILNRNAEEIKNEGFSIQLNSVSPFYGNQYRFDEVTHKSGNEVMTIFDIDMKSVHFIVEDDDDTIEWNFT